MARSSLSVLVEVLDNHADEFCFSQYTDDAYIPRRHCLLAWMAIEAGIELPPSRYNSHVVGMAGTRRFSDEIQQAYGISFEQIRQLQFANDESGDVEGMKNLLLNLVRQWAESSEIAA